MCVCVCAGRAARRLKLEVRMDHAVSRVLEVLQPAAARAALAAHVAAQGSAAVAAGASAAVATALSSLSAAAAAVLVARMPAETRAAVETDLDAYVSAAQTLRREKAEMPLCWALCLQSQVRR